MLFTECGSSRDVSTGINVLMVHLCTVAFEKHRTWMTSEIEGPIVRVQAICLNSNALRSFVVHILRSTTTATVSSFPYIVGSRLIWCGLLFHCHLQYYNCITSPLPNSTAHQCKLLIYRVCLLLNIYYYSIVYFTICILFNTRNITYLVI